MNTHGPLHAFARACRRQGVLPTRYLLVVNITKQTTCLFERGAGGRVARWTKNPDPHRLIQFYTLRKQFRCSTSMFGIGEQAGSNMTPRGLHRIAEKIGGGWPSGTVFKGRKFVGFTWQGWPEAMITTRILWLEGLEPGFNRGGDVDSRARYIYIHGTGDELTLGRPASHGCAHLAAQDLMPLYDKLPSGTLVWISER
jgi:L,D-transpeptidase YbiS